MSLPAEAGLEEGVSRLPLGEGEAPGARVQAQDDGVVPADGVGNVGAVGVFHARVRVVQVGHVAVDPVGRR